MPAGAIVAPFTNPLAQLAPRALALRAIPTCGRGDWVPIGATGGTICGGATIGGATSGSGTVRVGGRTGSGALLGAGRLTTAAGGRGSGLGSRTIATWSAFGRLRFDSAGTDTIEPNANANTKTVIATDTTTLGHRCSGSRRRKRPRP
jgi:hypothetical protein